MGAVGMAGQTGAQGGGYVGAPGPTGGPGPAGPQGPMGDTGIQGRTLIGPTGPVGYSGAAGMQGVSGDTGASGSSMPGNAGATGASGSAGPQGPIGLVGAQGAVGVVSSWTQYRDFNFDTGSANIPAAQRQKVAEIATYMTQNPSLQLGIDGSTPRGDADARNQSLGDRRANAVRDALMHAGVPAQQIQDRRLRRSGDAAGSPGRGAVEDQQLSARA